MLNRPWRQIARDCDYFYIKPSCYFEGQSTIVLGPISSIIVVWNSRKMGLIGCCSYIKSYINRTTNLILDTASRLGRLENKYLLSIYRIKGAL